MKSTVTDGECRQIHLTRDFFSGTFIHEFTPHCGSSVCVRDRTIFMPSVMTHERSSSLLCSHSSPLSLPALFLSTSSTPTSSITLPDQNTTAPNPRNEPYGFLAIIQPLTGYEHNVTDKFDVLEVAASIFQDSSVTSIYDLGDNGTESANAEIDDEHTRNALASPLYIQEREANADLSQAYRSNEESLLPGARSIFCKHGGTPLHGCHRKENLAKSQMMVKSGTFWKDRRNECSPKMIFVNWVDKLSLKQ